MTGNPSYEQLCNHAKKKGHKLTPGLKADLRKLADVSDDDLQRAYDIHVSAALASMFKVPRYAMERRLGDSMPKLKKGDST